jgi:hypothetical protein
MNLEFLGEKIEKQLQDAKDVMDLPSLEGESTDRFVTMLKDWRDFKGHELIGRGIHVSTRYIPSMYDIKTDVETRTVGITDTIVKFGLPFFILLIFLMYKSFSSYSKSFSKDGEYMGASIVFIILLLLTSETYFTNPLFWMVIMLQYVYIVDEDEPNEQINENKFYNLNK